jgi:hypothetical protein
MTAAGAETIRGTVQRCNGSTVILHERHEPIVISRYAKGLPTMEGGDQVELMLDGRGFVKGAVVLNMPAPPDEQQSMPPAATELLSIRQSVLSAASTFAASRLDLKSADVFSLAEKMEAWVLR